GGGMQVVRIGEIGLVKLVADSSIGSGVHRVEALVGRDALRQVRTEQLLVNQLAGSLKVPTDQLPQRVDEMVTRLRDAEKEIEQLRREQVLASAGSIADRAIDVDGVSLVAEHAADDIDGGSLRSLAGEVRGRLGPRPGVVALFSRSEGKVSFVVATTPAAQGKGLAARALSPEFVGAVSGRAGGKADMAQGGGSDAS